AHYTNAINGAPSIEVVQNILNQANAQNTANKEANEQAALLQKTKNEALDELAKLTELTPSEIEGFTSAIGSVNDIQTIMSTLESARAQNEANKNAAAQEKELEEAKNEAIKQLDGLNLKDDERQAFVDQINVAKSQDDIKTIVSDAKAVSDNNDQATSEQQLSDVKADAKIKIGSMNLTNEEKTAFTSQIDGAKTINDVKSIVEEAQKVSDVNDAAEKELTEAKQNAIKQLDLLNLKDSEKQSFVKQINNAVSKDEIDTIILDAKVTSDKNDQTASEQQLVDAKNDAKSKISAMNLKDEIKATFISQVDAAKSISEVKGIVEDAQKVSDVNDASEKELSDAKTKAINDIKRLNLTNDEMTRFINQVNEAQTVEKIKSIASNAKIQSDANDAEQTLQSAKDKAIAYLKTLNLTKDELNAYTLAVQNATSIKEIDTIKTNATNHSDKNNGVQELKSAKETAIKQIQALDLNNTQYFIDQVNQATSIQEVNTIVGNAKQAEKDQKEQAEAEKLAKAKQDALNELEGFNLKNQKEHFTNLINNAKSSDEITRILADAKKVSDKNNEPKKQGSITFNIYNQNLTNIDLITLSFDEGTYSVTLADLGYGHGEYMSGDLTGEVVAGQNKSTTIKIKLPSVGDSQKELQRAMDIFVDMLNDYRAEKGVNPLQINPYLTNGTIIRAKEIEEVFDHQRPDGTSYTSVIKEVQGEQNIGFSALGENIAMASVGRLSAEDVAAKFLDMWQKSEGHNKNMLNSMYEYVGFAIYVDRKGAAYAVTIFGGKQSTWS
ncbi:CAP domain-containing protein, partial [Vagococcus elongatus]